MSADGREGGFVAIHRRLRSSALYRSLSGEQRSVFLALLLLANWKPGRFFHGGTWVSVERGELAYSLSSIAKEAAVSVKVVRTTLRKLMADDTPTGGNGPFLTQRFCPLSDPKTPGELRQKAGTTRGTSFRVIRIEKYAEYQDVRPGTGTGTGTDGARVGHGSGTTGAPIEPREPVEPREPREPLQLAPPAPPPAEKRRNGKGPDPRHRPLQDRLVAVFKDERRTEYGIQGRDGKAIADLLRLSSGNVDEVETRWRRALKLGAKWPGCGSLPALVSKWNELAAGIDPHEQEWRQARDKAEAELRGRGSAAPASPPEAFVPGPVSILEVEP